MKVKISGKSIPVLAIVAIAMSAGLVSAALVSYLSNTVTKPVTVESPIELSGTITYQYKEEPSYYDPFGCVLYIWGADQTTPNVVKWFYLGSHNGGDGAQWDGHKITIVKSQWSDFNGQFYLKNTGTAELFTLWRGYNESTGTFLGQVTTTEEGVVGGWDTPAAYAIDGWVDFDPAVGTVGDPRETVGNMSHMYYDRPDAGSRGGNLEVKLQSTIEHGFYNGRYLDLVECGWTDLNHGWYLKWVADVGGAYADWYELYHDAGFTEPGIPENPAKFVPYGGTEGYLDANRGRFVEPVEPTGVTKIFDGTMDLTLHGGDEFYMDFEATNLANREIEAPLALVIEGPANTTWTMKEIEDSEPEPAFTGTSGVYYVAVYDGLGTMAPNMTKELPIRIQIAPHILEGTYTIKALVVWEGTIPSEPEPLELNQIDAIVKAAEHI